MKLININTKNLNPKRLFRSKKKQQQRSLFSSRSDPSSSFSSGASSSSSAAPGATTPTSVLPEASGDWSSDISAEIHSDLAKSFHMIDRDNDGIISRQDLEALLTRLGAQPPTTEEVAIMLSEVDSDGRGCISIETLMSRVGSVCGPVLPDSDDLREAFQVFDTDHDGRISAEELLRVFKAIGDERCTLEECRRMIDGVDRNGDGFVCFEDFSRMMELQR